MSLRKSTLLSFWLVAPTGTMQVFLPSRGMISFLLCLMVVILLFTVLAIVTYLIAWMFAPMKREYFE